jgi:hypothetical protein
METDVRVLQYLTEFLVYWEMFQTNVVEKIKTHVLLVFMSTSVSNIFTEILANQSVSTLEREF